MTDLFDRNLYDAVMAGTTPNDMRQSQAFRDGYKAGAFDASRIAAITGLPVIPEGWRLAGIVDFHDQRRFRGDGQGYKASLMTTDDEASGWADGYGVRYEDAIAAAIKSAKEAEGE